MKGWGSEDEKARQARCLAAVAKMAVMDLVVVETSIKDFERGCRLSEL